VNIIGIIVLAAILADLIVNAVADYLNLKRLNTRVPRSFSGYYDPQSYRRSQLYLKTNTRLSWISHLVQIALILIFWFAGGFELLDGWLRRWQFGEVLRGVAYIGALGLFMGLASLPFNIYHTFVIEARFGFNRTTWRTFVLDKIKALILAVGLGAPLLAGILAFFQYFGPNAWWYCWIAVTAYTLVMHFLAPTLIMPLFNTFTPLEEGDLKSAILAYARSIRFPLKNIMVMDGSRRSAKSNAFFTGFGRNKRIVLFDTLIEKHTVDELVAVLAHEMGHYKKRHILIMLLSGIVQTGLMFFLLSWFISYSGLYDAFYVTKPSVYTGLVFFALVYSPVEFFLGIFGQILSRRHEYEADRFAADTTHRPSAMVEALKKLSVHNLSNLTPHPFYVFLNYSHPPVLDRIAALEPQKT
jgi:STE24 endopeptidase